MSSPGVAATRSPSSKSDASSWYGKRWPARYSESIPVVLSGSWTLTQPAPAPAEPPPPLFAGLRRAYARQPAPAPAEPPPPLFAGLRRAYARSRDRLLGLRQVVDRVLEVL